jgi:hypothetical protein
LKLGYYQIRWTLEMTENQRPHCVVIGVGTGTGLACAKKIRRRGL